MQKKIYIKGQYSIERLQNLKDIAKEKFGGNFSEMTNYAYNVAFNLDPETGARLPGKPKQCAK